jgi:hypothetical protein
MTDIGSEIRPKIKFKRPSAPTNGPRAMATPAIPRAHVPIRPAIGDRDAASRRKRICWIACACAVPFYFALATFLKIELDPSLIKPDARGERHQLMRPFMPFLNSRFAMVSVDPWFGKVADAAGQYDSSSPIMLYEDDKPLGPAHSTPHTDIAALGHGRFSHWRANYSVFVFSSSDNTDPRTNGHTYWAVNPPSPPIPDSGIAPDTPGEKYHLVRPFRHLGASAFAAVASDQRFGDVADVAGQYDSSSPVVLYEDGKPLGPAHSTPHSTIGDLGHGRFSQWKTGSSSMFVFSSSDNTDPETNGRSYWAVKPDQAPPGAGLVGQYPPPTPASN